MIRFECDYAEGAAPQLLERLTRTNLEQTPGYAVDGHCQRARDLIRAACAAPQAEVEFLVGGTQANQTVISAALRPYQGALCAQTGHINVHETGAIEATGHKVLPLPSQDGKITPKQVEQFCAVHWADPTREHIVQPGMVYLSQPTETGCCTPGRSWRASGPSATGMGCICTSTGPGAAMGWPRRKTMWISPTWPG